MRICGPSASKHHGPNNTKTYKLVCHFTLPLPPLQHMITQTSILDKHLISHHLSSHDHIKMFSLFPIAQGTGSQI